MNISTKYNIDDEVYIRRGKGAQKRKVLAIYIKIGILSRIGRIV